MATPLFRKPRPLSDPWFDVPQGRRVAARFTNSYGSGQVTVPNPNLASPVASRAPASVFNGRDYSSNADTVTAGKTPPAYVQTRPGLVSPDLSPQTVAANPMAVDSSTDGASNLDETRDDPNGPPMGADESTPSTTTDATSDVDPWIAAQAARNAEVESERKGIHDATAKAQAAVGDAVHTPAVPDASVNPPDAGQPPNPTQQTAVAPTKTPPFTGFSGPISFPGGWTPRDSKRGAPGMPIVFNEAGQSTENLPSWTPPNRQGNDAIAAWDKGAPTVPDSTLHYYDRLYARGLGRGREAGANEFSHVSRFFQRRPNALADYYKAHKDDAE